jgi:hypothetical protein
MRIVVGILASHDDVYDSFKRVWESHIEQVTLIVPNIDFVFLYGGEENRTEEHCVNCVKWTNLYCSISESLVNVLRKTLRFFEFVNEKYPSEEILVLRTNLSTLFDFVKFKEFLNELPRDNLFGGSLIDGYNGAFTKISGTNFIMTRDIMDFILLEQDRFSYNLNEDVEISALVLFNRKCKMIAVKRLDFLQDIISFHKCKMFEKVFCYRFKSNNRKQDIENMEDVMKVLHLNGSVNDYIKRHPNTIKEEHSMFQVLSECIWTIDNGPNPVLLKKLSKSNSSDN